MQVAVEKLKKTLEQETGLKIEFSLVKNGIYKLYTSKPVAQLFIYSDHVEVRPSLSSDLPAIHLDHDILRQQFDKAVSRIVTLWGFGTRYHARQTVVARIDKNIAMEFQREHHLQIALPGKYRYGLYLDGELVSIVIFSGGRRMNNRPLDYRSFELLRFCHKDRLLIVGGLSKLISAFRKDFAPGDIMTYVDRDWSQDSSLKSIGFIEVTTIPPQRYQLDRDVRRLISDKEYDDTLKKNATTHVKYNSGSTKMVLYLRNSENNIGEPQ